MKESLVSELQNSELLLILDYDGTLTEIVQNPMDAILTTKRKSLLEQLNAKSNVSILINSGRPIEELLQITKNISIDLMGNHGLFFFNSSTQKMILTIEDKNLDEWDKKMQECKFFIQKDVIPKYSKLWLQENKHGFVLHTRTMDKQDKEEFLVEINHLLSTTYKNLSYSTGKEVIEIKPSKLIDKGKGIEWYIKTNFKPKSNSFKILVAGDDVTDEDMFKLINSYNNGVSIRIGSKSISKDTITCAKIIIDSVEDFYQVLEKLIGLH